KKREEEEVVVEQTETDIVVDEEPSAPAAAAAPPPATSIPADTPPEPPAADDAMTGVETAAASAPAPTLTMEERKAKMDELRQKRAASIKRTAHRSLTAFNPTASSSQMIPTAEEQRVAAENLYRDANTLIYGDNKPSEDAIDRMVGKINKDIDKKSKFSRKRPNEDEGDITYINEHNRVFNKKIARYYDKYTAEIRASFERGTAL
ncbi:SYF2 splicing factor-domain-containing protein, partial [Mycena olivaceomarginata]